MKTRLFLTRFLIVAFILLASMPRQWYERMRTIETYQEDESAMTRIRTWGFAYNVALHNPILGAGFTAFTKPVFRQYSDEPSRLKASHSIYFGVLAQHGFVIAIAAGQLG